MKKANRQRCKSGKWMTLLSGAALILGLALLISACGSSGSSGSSSSGGSSSPGNSTESSEGGSGGLVGVILPSTSTSARWEAFDKPMLEESLKEHGLESDIQNAQGESQKFVSLAEGMINEGAEVLILASLSPEAAITVEEKAKAAGIPTIDYEFLNENGSVEYFVTFDSVQAGELQGEGILEATKGQKDPEIIQIEGAPGEILATNFYKGQQKILKPSIESGELDLVTTKWTPEWDSEKGGLLFEQALTANGGKVDGVVAANDGLAGAIITVLKKNGLAGKVPVTGQDGSAEALTAILNGDQYMTVFKPIKIETEAAGNLAAALLEGNAEKAEEIAPTITKDPKNGHPIHSVLLKQYSITKDGIKKVIAEGYVSAEEVCTAEVAAVCKELGISE
jgi:D-xylose transport system substrate-binding protein